VWEEKPLRVKMIGDQARFCSVSIKDGDIDITAAAAMLCGWLAAQQSMGQSVADRPI
jgi:hypothetical protein